MLYKHGEGITINGKWYPKDCLNNPVQNISLEKDILLIKVFEFLKHWYDSQDFILMHTSGSTGPPKIMELSKEGMIASALMTGNFFNLQPGMTAHLGLSPDFVAGKMMIVRALTLGLNLITTDVGANPLKDLKHSIDFSAMVPLQVAHTLRNNHEKINLVEKLIIGGEAIHPSLEEALQEISTQCWHTYGMTETLSHIALRKVNGQGKTQWFKPLPGVSISTDNRDCLVIDAPALNSTSVVTNDIVEIHDDMFMVIGRFDDVIISAGHKIHPQLLEKKISTVIPYPFFIAGEPHTEAGVVPVLYIETGANDLNPNEIFRNIEKLLPAYQLPRKIRLISKFSYLDSGKVNRLATVNSQIEFKSQ